MSSLLITGGTGTLGQALAKDALKRGFERICIFSRDEFKQAMMRQQMTDSRLRWFLGDVRDRERLRRALEGVEMVVHAAALKRVEAGEYDPLEFVKTNVIGTANLIEAAHDAGVKRVVAVSTDKAVNPQHAYGASKLLMEKMTLAANNMRGLSGPNYSVVRLGNIAGSRGSVIDLWRGKSIVPLTDKRCTRYWFAPLDCVNTVWDALRIMPISVLIPHAPAYSVWDLAFAMGVRFEEVGLRPGEQLHESMTGEDSSEIADRLTVKDLRERLNELAAPDSAS